MRLNDDPLYTFMASLTYSDLLRRSDQSAPTFVTLCCCNCARRQILVFTFTNSSVVRLTRRHTQPITSTLNRMEREGFGRCWAGIHISNKETHSSSPLRIASSKLHVETWVTNLIGHVGRSFRNMFKDVVPAAYVTTLNKKFKNARRHDWRQIPSGHWHCSHLISFTQNTTAWHIELPSITIIVNMSTFQVQNLIL